MFPADYENASAFNVSLAPRKTLSSVLLTKTTFFPLRFEGQHHLVGTQRPKMCQRRCQPCQPTWTWTWSSSWAPTFPCGEQSPMLGEPGKDNVSSSCWDKEGSLLRHHHCGVVHQISMAIYPWKKRLLSNTLWDLNISFCHR
jgi:hypothetical protein